MTVNSFSTGTDSPVKAASSIFNELASKRRKSAGTTSPASNRTISPGTNSSLLIVTVWPLRKTLAFGVDISLSASIACSAFASWTTPMIALIMTTAKIIIESTTSWETTAEIIAAASKTMIIKSLNCSKNFCAIDFFLPSSNSLGPYSDKRFCASSFVNPLASVCISSRTCCASCA